LTSFSGRRPRLFPGRLDAKCFQLLARLQRGRKPSRLQSAPGPCLRRILRIAEFRSNRSPRAAANSFSARSACRQTPQRASRSSSVRRSSKTFAPRAASTCSLSFVSLSIDMDFRLSIGITVNYLTVRHAYESDSQKSITIFDLYRRFQEKKPEGNNAACATAFQSERNVANKIARGGFNAASGTPESPVSEDKRRPR
jgi:hypothetical protein